MPPPEDPNPSEWILLKALWAAKRATVRDLQQAVAEQTGWAYSTEKTLLERMERKGLVSAARIGPVKQYRARKSRRDLVPKAVSTFLDRVLDDSFAPLVHYIAQSRGLSEKEIQQLERLLEPEDES